MIEPLTAADRCDRCGAQALHHVPIAGTGGLLLCGHHHRQHKDRLAAATKRRREHPRRESRA
jgi:hypothetical protein